MQHGFDVIHFNHLEGLPAEVLTIKERLPHIKILFSMHDYYSLCPQVTFLYQGKELCEDSQSGKKCQSCLTVDTLSFSIPLKLSYQLIDKIGLNPSGRSAKLIQALFRKIVRGKNERISQAPMSDDVFGNWHQIVDLINEHVDHVLPVSDRVRQIAIQHGIRADLLRVLRLGKDEAIQFRNAPPPKGTLVQEDGSLTLVYLGYMTLHKGFFFCWSLSNECLPNCHKKSILWSRLKAQAILLFSIA